MPNAGSSRLVGLFLRALFFGAGLSSGCAGAQTTGGPEQERDPNGSPTTTPADVPTHAVAEIIHELGEVVDSTLPFSLMPSVQRQSSLLIAQGETEERSYVRRYADGSLGPIVVLDAERPVALFDRPEPTLITSDGRLICVRLLERATRSCLEIAPRAVIDLGGTITFVEDRAARRRPGDSSSRREVLLRRVGRNGELSGRAEPCGLEIEPGGAGLGLHDAVGTAQGAQVLWFAAAPSIEREGEEIPQVRLLAGLLSPDGSWSDGSELELFSGDRGHGHLAGYVQPRLLSSGPRALYLVQKLKRGIAGPRRWVGRRISSSGVASLRPSSLLVQIDPSWLASGRMASGQDLGTMRRIDALSPRTLLGQPRDDAERVAWLGDEGLLLSAGKLMRVARSDDSPHPLPHPFVAKRSRIHWAKLEPSGWGLAATAAGYVELSAGGELRALSSNSSARLHAGAVARLGGRWLAVAAAVGGGQLVELPAEQPRGQVLPVAPAGVALVGGDDGGWLIAVRSGALVLWRVDRAGVAEVVGEHRLGLLPRLSAAQRPGGGVLVAASRWDHTAITAALDGEGRLLAVHASTIVNGRLSALPIWKKMADRKKIPSVALLHGDAAVAWLAADGSETARRELDAASKDRSCIDGHPASPRVAGPSAGELSTPAAFADLCLVAPPSWAADGSLRWFGSHAQGIDSRAVAGVSPGHDASAKGGPANTPPGTKAPHPPAKLRPLRCPLEMVEVSDSYCVDRFEGRLFDLDSGRPLAPDFPLASDALRWALRDWSWWRTHGDLHARALPLPPLPSWSTAAPRRVSVTSTLGVVPSAFISGLDAARACASAGKRLCTLHEYVTACRGERQARFPYGSRYRPGACNVHRASHPAAWLHDSAAVGHLDPRLVHVADAEGPLLLKTGASASCVSRWGDDGIYDMVGNLDEWVADRAGAFAGGAFMRRTKSGCSALVRSHPKHYLDYSTGLRCCRDFISEP